MRQFAEQITPRGDTFVIRAYGDSIDAQGRVVARAWCEAIVQRSPDYVDKADESHVKAVDLRSEATDASAACSRSFHSAGSTRPKSDTIPTGHEALSAAEAEYAPPKFFRVLVIGTP